MPSLSSIHDHNMLVWGLEAMSRGILDEAALLNHLRSKVEQRQAKWGLTEREAQHTRLVEMVQQELEVFELYDRTSRTVTPLGKQLLTQISEEQSRTPIIECFLPKLLGRFEDVEAFLKFLNERGEVRIPRVPGKKELGLEVGHRGKRLSDVETPEALRLYIDATFVKIKDVLPEPNAYWERATYWQANSRGKRHYDVVRTIVRDAALQNFKYGDVKYKVIRDRLWYMCLINWSEHLDEGFDGEVCYPLYEKDPNDVHPTSCVESPLGPLSIRIPGRSELPFPIFVQGLWSTFQKLSRKTVGYVPIPDLRDATCRAIRLSDYAFNEMLRRFSTMCSRNQQPFTCNWETATLGEITQKRLPVEVPGIGIRKAISIHKF